MNIRNGICDNWLSTIVLLISELHIIASYVIFKVFLNPLISQIKVSKFRKVCPNCLLIWILEYV